ncbi:MAG: hypothetical protein J5562_09640 [Clostridia bacterium]|nr:hypothetical protein [Clostridia bacterium]
MGRTTGSSGSAGSSGFVGFSGSVGFVGFSGSVGVTGFSGSSGLTGSVVPSPVPSPPVTVTPGVSSANATTLTEPSAIITASNKHNSLFFIFCSISKEYFCKSILIISKHYGFVNLLLFFRL